jgi:3-phenylpropionate/trans-cinnamate dioxygenase ferredoxin reductase component
MDSDAIVVIGGGLAAGKAVAAARDSSFDGRIVLLASEARAPYERPGLSKAYLRGEIEGTELAVQDAAFYADHDIDLRTGTTAVAIDREKHEVVTDQGERVGYTRLLIATGAEPRRLDVPGADLAGIHYLRTIDDADRLRGALTRASNVAVVGGGWIGSEVAASARQLGHPVTIVDPGPAPLHTVLGADVAAVFRELHTDNGVTLALGRQVVGFRGGTNVEAVETSNGQTIAADVVIVGVGVTPRVALASAAGIAVDNGINVDERLRTTDPHIFAAGDVAAAHHPFYRSRLRVEHWANALNQGVVAGRNLAGHHDVYDRLPYFFSDQYDVGIEYLGHARDWDRVVFRGDVADRKFIAFWMKDRRVVAAMSCNVWDVIEPLRRLITTRRVVDKEVLRDPDIALDEMLTGATT